MNGCFVKHFRKAWGKIWFDFRLNKIALHLRDQHVFMSHSLEILNVCSTLTVKEIFWKTQILFKKLEYRFLVQSTKIESYIWKLRLNATFPYKTALSEANIKTNRVGSNGSITKNEVLPETTLFFQKFCFSLRNSYKELIWCTYDLNVHIHTFEKRWSFVWVCFFPVNILKTHRVFINRNSVFADLTRWKENTYQWKYDI